MDQILLSKPYVGPLERQYLLRAFESGWICLLGPDVDAFERELAEAVRVADTAAVSSGTAGLHLAMLVLGVQPGDTVLVQSLTFAATANAVCYTGARPIFVDSSPTTWTMDPQLVADHLAQASRRGQLPAAVVPVDIFGQCADYDALRAVCEPYSIPIIEDAAEALGSTYRGRPAGGLGDVGVLSFNANKMVTCGGGGAVLTHSEDMAARVRYLACQAKEPAPHFEHGEIGYNYRLPNLCAAIGRAQLARLAELTDRRKAIRHRYATFFSAIAGVTMMPEADYGATNAWLSVIQLDPQTCGVTSDDLRLKLAGSHIEARPVWKPMHLQPAYAGCDGLDRGVATALFEHGLCLPSGPGISDSDQERVIDVLSELLPVSAR